MSATKINTPPFPEAVRTTVLQSPSCPMLYERTAAHGGLGTPFAKLEMLTAERP